MTAGSSYWQAETWAGVREDLIELTKKTAEALILMAEVYEACVDSMFMNNDLTATIFDVSNEYFEELQLNIDQKSTIGQSLRSFSNVYYTKNGEEKILDYCYNSNYQTTVKEVQQKWKSDAVLFNRFLNGNLG